MQLITVGARIYDDVADVFDFKLTFWDDLSSIVLGKQKIYKTLPERVKTKPGNENCLSRRDHGAEEGGRGLVPDLVDPHPITPPSRRDHGAEGGGRGLGPDW